MVMQGVSKRALQIYSKCYCVASVTKTFKGVEQWIICTLLSANVFVTLATQQHLEYDPNVALQLKGLLKFIQRTCTAFSSIIM
jgi:hypothetical protein